MPTTFATPEADVDVSGLEALDFDQVCSIKVGIPGLGISWSMCDVKADYLVILKCCGDQRLVCDSHFRERGIIFMCRCGKHWPVLCEAAVTVHRL